MIYHPKDAWGINTLLDNLVSLLADWTNKKTLIWKFRIDEGTYQSFVTSLGKGKEGKLTARLNYESYGVFIGTVPNIERLSLIIVNGGLVVFEIKSDRSSYETLKELFASVFNQVRENSPTGCPAGYGETCFLENFDLASLEMATWTISKERIAQEAEQTSRYEVAQLLTNKEKQLTQTYREKGFTVTD